MSRVLALYEYQARKDGELSFTKGDIISLDPNNRAEARWWHGTSEANPGPAGKFPANYVSPIDESSEHTVPAVAGYAFTARSHNEISLEVGQEVLVINPEPDAKWFMAEGKGRRGKIPANYVTLKDEDDEPPPPVPEDDEEDLPPPPPPTATVTKAAEPVEEPPPPVARNAPSARDQEDVAPPPVSRTAGRPAAIVPPQNQEEEIDTPPPPVSRDFGRAKHSPVEDVPPPVARDDVAAPRSPISPETDVPPPVARSSGGRTSPGKAAVAASIAAALGGRPPMAVPLPTEEQDFDAPPPPVARDGGKKNLAVDVPPPSVADVPPPAVDVPPPSGAEEGYEEGYEEGAEGVQEGEGQYEYYDYEGGEGEGEGGAPLSPFAGPSMEEEPDEVADGFMFNEPDMEDTIQLNESGMLLGGTLVKTIDYITRASSFSTPTARSNALQAMAQCFRVYCSPAVFFSKVKGRFMSALDNVDIVQMNCLELLMQWVKIAFHIDLATNKPLLEKVQDFMLSVAQANTTISATVCQEAQRVNQLTKILGTEKMSIMDASAPLEPESYPDTPEPKPNTILTFNTLDIAQQLALIQFNIFQDMSVSEFLKEAWKRNDAEKRAPGLLKHLRFERTKSLWLEEMVVTCKKDSERKKLMEKYSEIAEQCLALNNFSGFVIFMRVLESPRLVKLKKIYTSKTVKRIQSFRPYMDNNMREIRVLQDSRTPSIPYVKLWMVELTNLDQANKDYYEDTKLINWRKVQLLGMFLRRPQELLRCGGYKTLTVKPPVVAFIHSMQPHMTAEQIESQALALQK